MAACAKILFSHVADAPRLPVAADLRHASLHDMLAMSLRLSLHPLSNEAWECKPQEHARRTSDSSTCCQCFTVCARCSTLNLHHTLAISAAIGSALALAMNPKEELHRHIAATHLSVQDAAALNWAAAAACQCAQCLLQRMLAVSYAQSVPHATLCMRMPA